MTLSIIITVFNEKPTVLKAIEQAKGINIDKQIIIVDNCSTDGSREILQGLNDSSLEIVYQPKNYGYGCSVITGMNLSLGEYIFVHNSDLEYDPGCVFEMLRLAKEESLDAVFGSRLMARAGESKLKILKDRPFYLGTIITTLLTNIFYRKDFTDIIGNRFYRTEALKAINPQEFGVGFDFEVVSKLCKRGFKIKEIPVTYKPRTKGKKVKASDIVPAVLTMLKVKFLKGRYPLAQTFNAA
jgi:glycosyltransferase involved in cell wall biosynthesis